MTAVTQPNLIAPGVILQDIAPPPEPALVTGVPVFLGVAQTPIATSNWSTPTMLTLWTQFVQQFDPAIASPYLTYAVQGFFANGGRCCYVLLLPDQTRAALEDGLQVIEALNEIDLVCVPDLMQISSPTIVLELQSLVLQHCDRMGDRFAILDSLKGADVAALNEQRQRLVGNNGALYAPWIRVENWAEPIPPCGHLAGIYARSDRTTGVHHAPANAVLEGVLDFSLLLSDRDWQALNPDNKSGVNCLRSFKSRGLRVWGAKTLSQVSTWQYINVRRLIITVLRWADRHFAEMVFEPNTEALWMRLEREFTVYCESLWEQGALQGRDPETAFYVKCDEETNPIAIRNTGQVVIEVGLAATSPAEFIVISLIHGSSGVTFAQA